MKAATQVEIWATIVGAAGMVLIIEAAGWLVASGVFLMLYGYGLQIRAWLMRRDDAEREK